eukprot:CAMPEP_0170516544 /NCGR_PEP_ID=MMETSP0209-20121228/2728_1 /TAXON_ID=665100 ORGANISM="Litonotus pictus, Strain P1" /NCGR_SAMPLE_ID=MMETSP0209 /ASSEMBLY_ACC=CAM_ASM_000301 /LENGTH=159 /DNA_ID=CAMNT_0010801461 /DNA_START=144 /DNA_END=623 /DNA_ORIENTATION=-
MTFLTMAISWTSFASVAANFLLFLLFTSIGVAYFMQKSEKDDNEYEYFSKDTLEYHFKRVYNFLICLEEELHKLYKLEDTFKTVKTLALVYFAASLVDSVCLCMLLFIGNNILFLSSLAYKLKKQEIEELSSKVKALVCENLTKIESKIPRYTEKVKAN